MDETDSGLDVEALKTVTLEQVKAFHKDFYGASQGEAAGVVVANNNTESSSSRRIMSAITADRTAHL